MFRNYQEFLLILFSTYFVCISAAPKKAAGPKVYVTLQRPYSTETVAKFVLWGVEDFDKAEPKSHEKLFSNFNSSGHESMYRGISYSNPQSNSSYMEGEYYNFEIKRNDNFGGVGPEGKAYASCSETCSVQFTRRGTGKYGINFLGFHAEALKAENEKSQIRFYNGLDMIFELKMKDIVNYIRGLKHTWAHQFWANPNPAVESEGKKEFAWGYVNVFIQRATFDKVVLVSGVEETFKTDMHTFGFSSFFSSNKPRGFIVSRPKFLSTDYVPPKNGVMEASKKPLPKNLQAPPEASVEIVFESNVYSSFRHEWSAHELFEGLDVGSHDGNYVSNFAPTNKVQGTYSAPFKILERSGYGKYFATTDSWLNLTATGAHEMSYFGIHLDPSNRHGKLEFCLNGEQILNFYVADVLDDMKEKKVDASILAPGGKKFVFVNFVFKSITFDAIRFRSWSQSEDFVQPVAFDVHLIGKRVLAENLAAWQSHVNVRRSILKRKGPTPTMLDR